MPVSRRWFLGAAAGSALWVLVGCRPRQRPTEAPAVTPSSPAMAELPVPTRAPRDIILTPVTVFYEQQFNGIHQVDASEWQLAIDGLVEHPLTLTYEEVLARPRAEMMRTLECIGNAVGGNQIGNAVWAGCWLEPLLAEAGVKASAVRARFEAADGYDTSVPVAQVQQPGVLLAYEMNGEPLTAAHGFPLRLFIPGLYGQKMPKWITRIEFIDDDTHRGVWEKQGWSDEARVKTNSQIMTPTHLSLVPSVEMELFGVAYAGDRHITQVEVGVEVDGEVVWRPADELVRGDSDEVWVQFYASWTPSATGPYTLLVRATDATGFTQTERARGVLEGAFPDGTDKIHNIVVMVG